MSTTSKSKSSSAKRPKARPDRSFDPAILRCARATAEQYQVVLWFEDGEWFGKGVELPTTMNDGKTAEQCTANVRDAFVTTVAVMLEDGKIPPPPAFEGLRSEQLNARPSVEERLRIDTAAKQKIFEGVSDFVRWASLEAVGR
jgi:predicted RNase H-like HicB family nuclease